jgi:tRNA threonylcarbamoyladenosine biosynthesis protein TsaB
VNERMLAAVLRAGRGRLAVGWYQAEDDAWQPAAPIEVLTPAELSDRIQTPTQVCGELDETERRLIGRKRKLVLLASPAHSLRRPGFLAELGWQRWQAGLVDDPATLAPVYLHYNDPIPG